jgi:hypothetical protein
MIIELFGPPAAGKTTLAHAKAVCLSLLGTPDWRRVMMRLLIIVCLSAASLQIAIWSGLVAGWTTPVGSSLGNAATPLERATEPRSALTSSPDPLNPAARKEIWKHREAWMQTSAAEQEIARAIADLSAAREETPTLRARHREAEPNAVENKVLERAQAKVVDRGVGKAREEIRMLSLQIETAKQSSSIEQELAQERARAEALDRDLAAVHQEIKALTDELITWE